MNKLLLTIGCLIFTLIALGQGSIITDPVLQPGIYKNYFEFKKNAPSIPFDYTLTEKIRNTGGLGSGEAVAFYRINIEKDSAEKIGTVFGFCDGQFVYFNEHLPVLSTKTEFMKFQHLGKYCYFDDRECTMTSMPMGGGMTMGTTSCNRIEKVLDIESGQVIRLNKRTMKEILADDPELLAEFQNDRGKNKKIKVYMFKYFDRNDDRNRK